MVVDPKDEEDEVNAALSGMEEDEDGIMVTGQKNAMNLPHNRQNCTHNVFNKAAEHAESNKEFCDLCYCYVCDGPAKDCKEWSTHYPANETGEQRHYWVQCRKKRSTVGVAADRSNVSMAERAREEIGWFSDDIYSIRGKVL